MLQHIYNYTGINKNIITVQSKWSVLYIEDRQLNFGISLQSDILEILPDYTFVSYYKQITVLQV